MEKAKIIELFKKSQAQYNNPKYPYSDDGASSWFNDRTADYNELLTTYSIGTSFYPMESFLNDYIDMVSSSGKMNWDKMAKNAKSGSTGGGGLSSDTLQNIGDKLGDIFGNILNPKKDTTTTGPGTIPPGTPAKKGLSPLLIGGIVLGVLALGGVFIYFVTRSKK